MKVDIERAAMRTKSLFALIIMLALFWLPMWFAFRETIGVAWDWMRHDIPREYGKWSSAIACAAKAVINGRKC